MESVSRHACRRGRVIFALALGSLLLASPALAHDGDKPTARISAALSSENSLTRTLTVRLVDTDSGEPITGAVVRASAEMASPHLMRTVPVAIGPRGGGVYRDRIRFPMSGEWAVDVSVSGDQVVAASARLPAQRITFGALEQPSVAPVATPAVLETQIEDSLTRRDYVSMAMLWIHSLAALGWIVGVLVMAVALAPSTALLTPSAHARLADGYREWGAWLHWGFVPLIVLTGIYNMLNVTPFRLIWRPSELGRLGNIPYGALYEAILVIKLGLFLVLLITGTRLLIKTVRDTLPDPRPESGLVRSLFRTLGPSGLVYIATIPLILGAAMALRYVHVLSHVAEAVGNR